MIYSLVVISVYGSRETCRGHVNSSRLYAITHFKIALICIADRVLSLLYVRLLIRRGERGLRGWLFAILRFNEHARLLSIDAEMEDAVAMKPMGVAL